MPPQRGNLACVGRTRNWLKKTSMHGVSDWAKGESGAAREGAAWCRRSGPQQGRKASPQTGKCHGCQSPRGVDGTYRGRMVAWDEVQSPSRIRKLKVARNPPEAEREA